MIVLRQAKGTSDTREGESHVKMERFEDAGLENWNEEALRQGMPPPEQGGTRDGFSPGLQKEHDLHHPYFNLVTLNLDCGFQNCKKINFCFFFF